MFSVSKLRFCLILNYTFVFWTDKTIFFKTSSWMSKNWLFVSILLGELWSELSWRLKLNSVTGFPAVLGFLPVSKHLAEVGTKCPSHTHTLTHLYNCMLYKVPIGVMATPYPQQEGRCPVPKKCHGNFFFFLKATLPRNL